MCKPVASSDPGKKRARKRVRSTQEKINDLRNQLSRWELIRVDCRLAQRQALKTP